MKSLIKIRNLNEMTEVQYIYIYLLKKEKMAVMDLDTSTYSIQVEVKQRSIIERIDDAHKLLKEEQPSHLLVRCRNG